MINDQAAGLGGKVVAGTPRDSLYVLDVLYDRDGGKRPEMIVTDTASYSDIVFGLLTLAGFAYAPQLADLPDQKMWRIDRAADYGAFQDAARGRVDLARPGHPACVTLLRGLPAGSSTPGGSFQTAVDGN